MTGPDATPATRPRRHRLASSQLAALAAGAGDESAVAQLLAAERSWRLVQLRALLDALTAHPDPTGPLPPVAQAWDLLASAHQRAPDKVDRLLLHPHVGTWAGHTLRRLRGSRSDPAPLWVDVGYLHALAAAAAIRAGSDFSTRVPVRDGFAILPTLGGARLPGAEKWRWAQVRRDAGGVTVAAGDHTVRLPTDLAITGPIAAERAGADARATVHRRDWLSLPTLTATAGGQRLTVHLDHLDPYRDLRSPIPVEPLSERTQQRWRRLLAGAWAIIVEAWPELAAPLARGLFSVAPRPAAGRFRIMSASAGDAFGATIISEPEGPLELAVTLVHEFQHIKLGGLLHLAALQAGEPAQRLYAPWRDDPRPLGGLLQGVYAFTGITEFWARYRHRATGTTAGLAHFEFARWREQVTATLHELRELPQLTDLGRRLVSGLSTTAGSWQDAPVPPGPLAAAQAAVTDHRAWWRTCHLRPDPAFVAETAAAWQAGAAPPAGYPDPAVVTDSTARGLDARAVLRMWQLFDPAGFAALRQDPTTVAAAVFGATGADLAYVAGESATARAAYLAELATDSDRPGAWAGLALTADGGDDPLRSSPELLRAVHRRIRETTGVAPDPLALARWWGAVPATAASGPGHSPPAA